MTLRTKRLKLKQQGNILIASRGAGRFMAIRAVISQWISVIIVDYPVHNSIQSIRKLPMCTKYDSIIPRKRTHHIHIVKL